jgi:hypothetical protein
MRTTLPLSNSAAHRETLHSPMSRTDSSSGHSACIRELGQAAQVRRGDQPRARCLNRVMPTQHPDPFRAPALRVPLVQITVSKRNSDLHPQQAHVRAAAAACWPWSVQVPSQALDTPTTAARDVPLDVRQASPEIPSTGGRKSRDPSVVAGQERCYSEAQ